MACLDTSSLRNLLPSWIKRLIGTTSDLDRPYTSSERNTSLQEASHQVPVNPGRVDDEYQEYEPQFHQTPPLNPPIVFPKHAADRPMNDICGQVRLFIKYYGVTYRPPDSMQYMWLFVQYHDSSTGHMGVSLHSFNSDVRLQKRLESIVPEDEWQWLEKKYGLKLGTRSKPWWHLV